MIVITWNFTALGGVSLFEHCKILPLKMQLTYAEGGEPGCLVVSPEIAAILDYQFSFNSEHSPPGPIRKIGNLQGIPVWVNVDIVRNEALAVSSPDDIYPTAKLVIENLVEGTALDYLAQL